MENNLTWENRYSETDEPDRQGRWLSTCKFKNLTIGGVIRVKDQHGIYSYLTNGFFPIHKGVNPIHTSTWSTPKQAREALEYYWGKFMRIITDN